MNKRIDVRSKRLAEQYQSEAPWACISVVSEVGDWPLISGVNRVGLLQLAFHDRSSQHYVNHPLMAHTYFQKQQAEQVLDFVDQHWDNVEGFMIHCEAGISRSAAIAAAIELIKHGRGADNLYFDQSTPYVPNTHVYKVILKVWQERGGQLLESDLTKSKQEQIYDEPFSCR